MTEGEKFELMLDIAWRGIENSQQIIYKIDEKANNTITLSAVLMTLVGGILVGLVDKIYPLFLIFLIIDLILLAMSIYYAFNTVWLKKQEVFDIMGAFEIINIEDYLQACGNLAISIASWQKRATKTAENKSFYLKKSMNWLLSALGFIIFIAITSTIWYTLLRYC